MARTGKFSRKYGLFLSDASNEEIVSVSKELMNGMSAQIRSGIGISMAILAVSVVSSMLMISMVSVMGTSLTGSSKSFVFLTRITAIALLCLASVIATLVLSSLSDASSISSILWRNIRETADDEKAYEQTQAVKAINRILGISKNRIKFSIIMIACSCIALGTGFIFELLVSAGYL